MNKAWKHTLANIRLEYPDWQPDEEFMNLVKNLINGKVTEDEAVSILVEKYTVKQ